MTAKPSTPPRYATRSLYFPGSSTHVFYHRIPLTIPVQTSELKEGDKGKGRAKPSALTDAANLIRQVRSSWSDSAPPRLLIWEEKGTDESAPSAIWLFGLSHDPFNSGDLTAPSGSADLSGRFDLASLYTCMHNTYGNCEKCGLLGSISRCPRQPGQNTKLPEIIAGNGIEAFGRTWRSFGNALVEHYAWVEGWMAQRVAKTARSVSHPAPPMAVLGKENSSGIELEIHLSEAEWEEVASSLRVDTMWEHPEESQAGTWQRLWPSTTSGIHVRTLELNQAEIDTVVNRIRQQLGERSVLALHEEEDWTLLWLREDKSMRGMIGTVSLDERGWYCVWPSRWLVPDVNQSSKKISIDEHIVNISHDQREDPWTLRSTGPVDNASNLLNSFRSAKVVSPEQEIGTSDVIEDKVSQPHEGLPLLFDTQSWLDFDPALDMASDTADTPGTLGAPTPSGRIDGDHLAPINHDSVDAVSSKILSPTANPTPAAQRDWDMLISAYEMNQHEDIITENDFNFFDAPHTSMFDAFDDPKENTAEIDIGNHGKEGIHEHITPPDKPSWVSTVYALDHPAPPYSQDILPNELLVQGQIGEEPSEEVKSPTLLLETEDDSDDLFGERDDEIEEPSGNEPRSSSTDMHLPDAALRRITESRSYDALGISKSEAHHSQEQQLVVVLDPLESQNVAEVLSERRCQPEERMTWLRWTALTHKSQRAKRKWDSINLACLFGDGFVKDRKGYRRRLSALRQHQSRLRFFHRIDVSESSDSDDSSNDTEMFTADSSSQSSWRDYGTEKTADAAHGATLPVPQSHTSRLDLSDTAWACPHLGSEALHTLLPAITPAEMHPIVAPVHQTIVSQSSCKADNISHTFRAWLTSAITEDPVLRDWLRGDLTEDSPLTRNKQSDGIRVRLGLCGRLTDLAADSVKFWKQLGLTPFSGQKDVSTSLIFDSSFISPSDAATWHLELESSYMAHGFGRFVHVDHFSSSKPLIQVSLPEVEDALVATKQLQLGSVTQAIIILIPEISPTQKLKYIQRIYDQYSHIYPETASKRNFLQLAFTNRRHDNTITDRLASSIYHHIRVSHNTGSSTVSESTVSLYSPSFTLRPARDTPASLFAVQWPPPSINPQDTGRMLHLAYTLAPDHTVVASLIDELGETWRTFHVPSETGSNRVTESLEKLWRSVQGVASGAMLEWRFIVIRHGHCCPEELRFWASLYTRQAGSALAEAQVVLLQMALTPVLATRTKQLVIDPPPRSASTAMGSIDVPVVYKGAFICGDATVHRSKRHQIQHLLSTTTTQSTICQTDSELLNDIKASYAHLCHLGHWRWSFALAEDLPPHIQAIRTYESIMSPQ